jgi:hypothetical protein
MRLSPLCFPGFCLLPLLACGGSDAVKGEADGAASDSDAALDVDGGTADFSPCDSFGVCDDIRRDHPEFELLTQLVPSELLPPGVDTQMANNNVDATYHAGRIYVTFRSASHHHPRGDAEIYVVSSADLQEWRFEARFQNPEDMREPQIVAIGEQLHAYWTLVADKPLSFDVIGVQHSVQLAPGDWTDPEDILEEGLLAWRIVETPAGAETFAYKAGGGALSTQPYDLYWLETQDGSAFAPVVDDTPVIMSGGVSETDRATLADGTSIAVVRNETGDETGFGSKICTFGPDAPAEWECKADPRKFDSPLVFNHNETIYLIGRRNVTDSGNFDLGYSDLLPLKTRQAAYAADYWGKPKRCSLWTISPETLEVDFVLDLPSRGDTCFAEIVPLDDDQLLLFNYTSPLDGEDLSWRDGQNGDTLIYFGVLSLPQN